MGRVLQGEAGDPNTCRRCGGTTFEMERKVSKSSAWHTKCFSCKKCNKPFLSLHYVYEAEDGEIMVTSKQMSEILCLRSTNSLIFCFRFTALVSITLGFLYMGKNFSFQKHL